MPILGNLHIYNYQTSSNIINDHQLSSNIVKHLCNAVSPRIKVELGKVYIWVYSNMFGKIGWVLIGFPWFSMVFPSQRATQSQGHLLR